VCHAYVVRCSVSTIGTSRIVGPISNNNGSEHCVDTPLVMIDTMLMCRFLFFFNDTGTGSYVALPLTDIEDKANLPIYGNLPPRAKL
jgi:hypothetical protein